jgi:hypothetical protein
MAEIIIIRAGQNRGKTTTTGLVYQELLKHAEEKHVFSDKIVIKESLALNNNGATIDFTAILTIKNKKIGIVSAGDFAKYTKRIITIFIDMNIDIIICCSRTVNKKGSTYRMIMNDFSQTNNVALQIFTKYDLNEQFKNEIKMPVVEEVVNKTLEIIDK